MKLTREEIARAHAYAAVFNTEEGQRVMEDLDRHCNVHASLFSSDAMRMAYLEGRREVALRIRKLVELVNAGRLEEDIDPITGDDYNG